MMAMVTTMEVVEGVTSVAVVVAMTSVVMEQAVAAAEKQTDGYGKEKHLEKGFVHDFWGTGGVPAHQSSASISSFYLNLSKFFHNQAKGGDMAR
ncbi:MAG: hypothetical protein IKA23_06130 [Akkermansia sp.]|nr:hypothetical protein [Akkermansia sp.]